jgi:hypothetical protein
MENKYFIPKIEDIRVGYECEIQVYGEDRWLKTIFSTLDFKSVLNKHGDIYSIPEYIRVPYLSKEQIEAEGWKFDSERNSLFLGEQQKFIKMIDEVLNYELTKFGTTILIQKVYPNMHNANGEEFEYKSNILFFGECKDINTFRYICKLLNI